MHDVDVMQISTRTRLLHYVRVQKVDLESHVVYIYGQIIYKVETDNTKIDVYIQRHSY